MKDKIYDSKTTIKETSISAPAVVIGCSQNNKDCDHTIHSTKDDFYTIDINKDINPDYVMDIAKDKVPNFLKNKFQLTIFEYLPYYTYNSSEASKKYLGFDGQKGLDNAMDITTDNGFIMVVGSTRDYHSRNCIGKLNYLEIAKGEEGIYILLIPKNQKLNFSEVMKQVDNLPNTLKESIKNASSQRYKPEKPSEFCKLNYTPSEKNKDLISDLSLYYLIRGFEENFTRCLYFFQFKIIEFGHSQDEKLMAVNAVIQVLLGNASKESLKPHKSALTNGRLGALLDKHLNGKSLDAFIYNDTVKNQSYHFKNELSNVKNSTELESESVQLLHPKRHSGD